MVTKKNTPTVTKQAKKVKEVTPPRPKKKTGFVIAIYEGGDWWIAETLYDTKKKAEKGVEHEMNYDNSTYCEIHEVTLGG